MSNKTLFFFDTETSGLDAKRHTILQIAWIIEKNGVPMVERSFDIKPDLNDDLNFAALDVNNFTIERMIAGKDRQYVLEIMRKDLKEAIGGGESIVPVGHQVSFDIDFLYALAAKGTETFWLNFGNGSMLTIKKPLCTLAMCHFLDYAGVLKLPDYKLTTVCKHLNIELTHAHDAMGDVVATRKVFHYAKSRILNFNKG